MPTRGFATSAAALMCMLSALPAAAQPAVPPTPAEIAARIDDYRFHPRTPGAYRALAGLGDPGRGADNSPGALLPSQQALLAQMLPNQQPIEAEYWYPRPGVCRTDYALSVAEAR